MKDGMWSAYFISLNPDIYLNNTHIKREPLRIKVNYHVLSRKVVSDVVKFSASYRLSFCPAMHMYETLSCQPLLQHAIHVMRFAHLKPLFKVQRNF